jgi:hypothetical protein
VAFQVLEIPVQLRPLWTRARIVATLFRMPDDDPNVALRIEPAIAPVELAVGPIDRAAEGGVGLAVSAPPDRAREERLGRADARAGVNKVHEWAAAVVVMALITAILFGFLFFMRGVSL